jgi:peptidoglycan-N-acetylglucosamine deacetylase
MRKGGIGFSAPEHLGKFELAYTRSSSFRLDWSHVIAVNIMAVLAWLIVLCLPWDAGRASANAGGAAAGGNDTKRIAFSFDDAPRAPGAFLDAGQRPQMLIAALKEGGVKGAVFFTNPGRIGLDSDHEKAISAYVAAGHLIANHTANHMALSAVSAAVFLADVDAAERYLRGKPGYRPWLRFPRLDEGGRDKAKRDAVRAGLKQRGMRNGYVTADGWDWFMEGRTVEAARTQQPMDIAALKQLYVETNVESAEAADKLARRTLGRAPVQMLLLHETDLAALYVADLAKALRAKGWQIVSADVAYADPMGKAQPDVDYANGTMIEMLAWQNKVTGGRWFERNDRTVARKLFATRVLHD